MEKLVNNWFLSQEHGIFVIGEMNIKNGWTRKTRHNVYGGSRG